MNYKEKEEYLFKKGGYVEDNKDSLRFKRELMVSLMEESKSLPEKDKRKENILKSNSIKKNCVVKQKQVLVHLRIQFDYLKKSKEKIKEGKESKHPKSNPNKEELCFKADANACASVDLILLSEEDNRWKGNGLNSSPIKKNCSV